LERRSTDYAHDGKQRYRHDASAPALDPRTDDPARLLLIDETAVNTKTVRLCGRCPRGKRLIDRVPQGHWKTITFVAALRRNGIRAPCTVDGSAPCTVDGHERSQVPGLCPTISGLDP
jgi:hypothetical protein